jgi:hypothetical protein
VVFIVLSLFAVLLLNSVLKISIKKMNKIHGEKGEACGIHFIE